MGRPGGVRGAPAVAKGGARLLGTELPEKAWTGIGAVDRRDLREEVDAKKSMRPLVEDFERRNHRKAAAHLGQAVDRILMHIDLWLNTDAVTPKAKSLLENAMRELKGNVKKLGWHWLDSGAEQIAKNGMLGSYDPFT